MKIVTKAPNKFVTWRINSAPTWLFSAGVMKYEWPKPKRHKAWALGLHRPETGSAYWKEDTWNREGDTDQFRSSPAWHQGAPRIRRSGQSPGASRRTKV